MAFEKIKKSKFRNQIEKMLAQGISPRKVSEWTRTQGDYINYLTIHQYRKEEFNCIQAAVKAMEPSPLSSTEIFEDGKRSVMADIAFLNKVISTADTEIDHYLREPGMLSSFKLLFDAASKAIELKLKLRGEGSNNDSTTINLTNISINQLQEEFEREIAEIKELETIETQGSVVESA